MSERLCEAKPEAKNPIYIGWGDEMYQYDKNGSKQLIHFISLRQLIHCQFQMVECLLRGTTKWSMIVGEDTQTPLSHKSTLLIHSSFNATLHTPRYILYSASKLSLCTLRPLPEPFVPTILSLLRLLRMFRLC